MVSLLYNSNKLKMKKLICYCLALSLLSSNMLVAQERQATHSTYYEQRVSHFRSLPAKKKCVIFLGDSITDGAEWGELFSSKKVLNRGISGDTSAGVLDRLDEVIRHQPKKIFLLIGINDIARGASVEAICHNIFTILEHIQEGSPETQIYVQSILPVNDRFTKFPGVMKRASLIPLVNQVLEENAAQRRYTYIDLHSRMTDGSGRLREEFTNDGLHLLRPAYEHWAEAIRTYL